MKQLIFVFFLILNCFNGFSQTNTEHLNFHLKFGEENIKLHKWYKGEKDTIQFKTIKFYISNLKLTKDNSVIYSVPNSYYLINLEDSNSQKISFNTPEGLIYSGIEFNLGIDSATNNAGVLGGALDPTNGMYWTWKSGYVNTKIEGISKQCTARKNQFQFHIGGYKNPFKSFKTITIELKPNQQLTVDFKALFSELDLQTTHTIMSPGKNAVDFAELVSTSIYSK
jgi:hypothetical protein|tara:strand:- start:218 stop:892 length:675 start_codon:yes stop_codon:yes gene_type:complete